MVVVKLVDLIHVRPNSELTETELARIVKPVSLVLLTKNLVLGQAVLPGKD